MTPAQQILYVAALIAGAAFGTLVLREFVRGLGEGYRQRAASNRELSDRCAVCIVISASRGAADLSVEEASECAAMSVVISARILREQALILCPAHERRAIESTPPRFTQKELS
jgi:hypothetical protein